MGAVSETIEGLKQPVKLKKKRQTELLKLYPDGDAIGRVIVEDYLNIERRNQGVLHDSSTVLSSDEIGFLINTLCTKEDIRAYNKRVEFRDAIYHLANMVSCLDNLFFCGYFGVLQLIKPTMTALNAYCITTELLKDVAFKEKCVNMLGQIETDLLHAWSNVKDGLRGLHWYDFLLKGIGEIHKFDFSVIRPDLENRIDGFMNLRDEAYSLRSAITEYIAATKGKRGKVKVPRNVITALHEVEKSNIGEIKVPKETQEIIILPMLQNMEITISTVYMITKTLTVRR